MKEKISKTFGERLGGGRPGPVSAAVTAVVVGSAVGLTVYRVLRS